MLFASLDFLLFLVPVLAGYWLLTGRPKLRLGLLLLASYFFYTASPKPPGGSLPTAWYFVGLLVLTTLVDYVAGLGIARANERGRRGSGWLVLSLITTLGLLGYFKYTGFLLEVAAELSSLFGVSPGWSSLNVALPIGISFYTFQGLSYTIDVWRGRLTAERSPLHFALYMAFFPALVAGPIVRASEFLPQLRTRLSLEKPDVDFALYRITKGLVKKVLLGDFIAASFTDLVFSTPGDFSSLENLLALYGFTLQIYADFSGYSDIAIGVARLFGFTLPENFDRPHQASSVGEFWRRWHMTLSTWLRDYLFFPLGGSRVSEGRAYFNLWLTMFLVGMWHGASWNFVIYGNLQAVAMLFNRWNRSRTGSLGAHWLRAVLVSLGLGALGALLAGPLLKLEDGALSFALFVSLTALFLCVLPGVEKAPWLRPVHVLLTFHFTVLSRVFFRADNLDRASEMIQKLVNWDGLGVRPGLFRLHSLHAWTESNAAVFGSLGQQLVWLVNWGVLVLMALGITYHFTPARWIARPGTRLFSHAPALALAGALGLVIALLSQLLSGPRANIYFAF